MNEDKVNENWDKFVKSLNESPADWFDSLEDDDQEIGRIALTLTTADEKTIQNAIKQGLDHSGILTHILDELNSGGRDRDHGNIQAAGPDGREDGSFRGPDGPDGPYIIGPTSR